MGSAAGRGLGAGEGAGAEEEAAAAVLEEEDDEEDAAHEGTTKGGGERLGDRSRAIFWNRGRASMSRELNRSFGAKWSSRVTGTRN